MPSLTRFSLALLIVCTVTAIARANPEVPAPPQSGPIALVGGTIHPVEGSVIEAGTILFDGGKIIAVGNDVKLPAKTEKIDCRGQHIYPGLFDAYTDIGLVEINSVRATADFREVGNMNPNVRALSAVNPDSELIPVTRSNGVLLALTAPRGVFVAGQSAVIQMDGWTPEQMSLKSAAGLMVHWPQPSSNPAPADPSDDPILSLPKDDAIKQLRKALNDARSYGAARQADANYPADARWESLQPVLAGELPLMVHAESLEQIQSAVAFGDEFKLKLIIVGGYDAPRCADLLKPRGIPVIVTAVYRLPRRRNDDYDAPYTLCERLRAAGVKFCISSSSRFGASTVRNLPYHAATAAAYGLPADEALKSITLYPAQILGVDDRVGSLKTGKDATLIITSGDPLETPTQVTGAYIQGRKVAWNDRHKRLFDKYQEKYKQLTP
ncbi:N-acetylglucosamine-6-phosphate deacetylase [Anatilimnocola aggregata]|uniref:N-acetylglucosamine-6-phosphate deacetylase n=1 Tax=Anatilimnocola aggregata TaxID=2528021 RepID=A0A517Y9T6_9BACT|nr:amidohydrolase family protein [Anatilimnocola aggregata]QDU26995.1 N-acetylglucosamine-6-phosphate deacetylase [Anatilimnocola aggregata]